MRSKTIVSSPRTRNRRLPLIVEVAPSRVRRNYSGGLMLDRIAGVTTPDDSDRPESWIGSTIVARNPGLIPIPGEGLTWVTLPDGRRDTLPNLIATAPEFFLGEKHLAVHGQHLGFLAKLLDSAMRLHVQAHPTAAFSRARLGSPHGKLEAYYVLNQRQEQAYIRLGFQRPPSRDEWRRIIVEQDIAAMDACFDPIPVEPGDVWLVPGGMPHAIGEGILMVEVMEPSDWVVRCEFEREGVVVPPDARYMGRDLEFCLDVFDYTAYSPAEVRERCRLLATSLGSGRGWAHDRLISADQTRCFEIQRVTASSVTTVPLDGRAVLAIQTRGSGWVVAGRDSVSLKFGGACWIAATAERIDFAPLGGSAEWLLCLPALVSPHTSP